MPTPEEPFNIQSLNKILDDNEVKQYTPRGARVDEFPADEQPEFDDSLIGSAVRGAARGFDEIGDLVLPDDLFTVQDRRADGVSGVIESISQFAVGFAIPGGVGIKALSKIGKVSAVFQKSNALRSAVQGAIGDFTAFDAHEERLSDTLTTINNVAVNNAVTQFLAGDPEDSEAMGRFKNVLEGAGLGLGVDMLFSAVKLFGKMVKGRAAVEAAKTATEKETASEVLEKSLKTELDEIENAHIRMEEDLLLEDGNILEGEQLIDPSNAEKPKGGPDEPKVDTGDEGIPVTKAESDAGFLGGDDEESILNLGVAGEKRAAEGDEFIERPRSVSHLERVQANINAKARNLKPSGSTDGSKKDIRAAEDEIRRKAGDAYKEVSGTQHETLDQWAEINAESYAEMLGMPISEMFGKLLKDAENSEDVGTRIAAHLAVAAGLTEKAHIGAKMILDLSSKGPIDASSVYSAARAIDIAALHSVRVRRLVAAQGRNLKKVDTDFLGEAPPVPEGVAKQIEATEAAQLDIEITTDPEALARKKKKYVEENHGSIEDLQDKAEMMDQIAKLTNPETMFKILQETNRPGMGENLQRISLHHWYFSLLSSPATNIINFGSSGLSVFTRMLQRSVGGVIHGALSGDFSQAAGGTKMIYGAISNWESIFRATHKTWKNNRGTLIVDQKAIVEAGPNSRYGKVLEDHAIVTGQRAPRPGDRLLAGKYKDPETAFGEIQSHMAKIYGWGTTLPGRGLQAGDEFWKQFMFYGAGYERAWSEGVKLVEAGKLDHGGLGRFARDTVRNLSVDGMYRSKKTYEIHYTRAAAEKKFPNAKERKKWIQKSVGKAIKEDEARATPLIPLAEYAKGQAEQATFTNRLQGTRTDAKGNTVLGHQGFAKSLETLSNSHPLSKFVVPFIRTPANIHATSRQMMDFSGPALAMVAKITGQELGDMKVAKILQGKFYADLTSGDKSRVADAYGRLAMGTSIIGWGVTMAMDGKLTGRGPTDPDQRAAMMMSGWRPYSMRFGDVGDIKNDEGYLEYHRVDPFGSLLGIVADMYQFGVYADDDDSGDFEMMLMSLTTAIASQLTEKTFFSGIDQAVSALEDPTGAMPRALRNSVASFAVPNFLSTVNRAGIEEVSDPHIREIRSFMDAITAKIPGLSDSLEPRRNILGEPIKTPKRYGAGTIGNLTNVWSPLVYSEVSDSALDQEFANLQHGFTPPRVKKYGLRLTEFRNESGQTAYDRWSQLQGEVVLGGQNLRQALTRLIHSSGYTALQERDNLGEESPRVKAMQQVIRKYRDRGFRQMLREYPELKTQLGNNQRKIQRGLGGLDALDTSLFSADPRKLFPN